MESEVTGARGNVLINVLGATSVASLLWLELLLELLWNQSETTVWNRGIKTTHLRRCLLLLVYLKGRNGSYLSSFASGLPSDGDTTGVVCSFLLSSEGLSPLPGSSGAQGELQKINIKTVIMQCIQVWL